jgi:hypothetical protein
MLRVIVPALPFTLAVARVAAAALFAFGVLGGAGPAAAAEAAAPCPIPETMDLLEGVTPESDLTLASFGLVRLAGARLPEAPWRGAALARLKEETGREVRVVGPEARDRWGRRAVRLVVVAGARPGGASAGRELGQTLVAAGLALVDAAEGEGPCRRALLAAESAARKRGLGLWAGDRYTPIPVAELARLKDRMGRFTLVEGRIRGVGERPQRTFLNFSNDWASDFTITIPKRIWSRMTERGLTAERLTGRLVRVRGVLEDRQGPALTLTEPDEIEILDEGRGS